MNLKLEIRITVPYEKINKEILKSGKKNDKKNKK